MNNKYDILPNISNAIAISERNSINLMNNSNNNNNINNNNSSDCESLLSEPDEKNKDKKAFYDKVFKTKYDTKSILNIAKDLNGNIEVTIIIKVFLKNFLIDTKLISHLIGHNFGIINGIENKFFIRKNK